MNPEENGENGGNNKSPEKRESKAPQNNSRVRTDRAHRPDQSKKTFVRKPYSKSIPRTERTEKKTSAINTTVDREKVFLQNTETKPVSKAQSPVISSAKKTVRTEVRTGTRAEPRTSDSRNKTRSSLERGTSKKTTAPKPFVKNSTRPAVKRPAKSGGKISGKKPQRNFIVKVCTSKKSCGELYGPFVWERICNEHDENIDQDSFEKNGITYKKSPCQGLCKRSSNVQVEDPKKDKTTQFSYMTPLKAAKLISSIRSGAAPENIKRL